MMTMIFGGVDWMKLKQHKSRVMVNGEGGLVGLVEEIEKGRGK